MDEVPAFRRDKHGNAVGDYPAETDRGRLLGINPSGNATYATADTVTLAVLGPDGSLSVPPRERALPAELPLEDIGMTPDEYLRYVADEAGLWRVLTDAGRTALPEDVDPSQVTTDGPVDADLDALLDALADASAGSEAGGRLRQLAMDRPERVVGSVDALFDLLAARPAATAENDAGWEAVARAADIAYAIARAAAADPPAVAAHLDALVETLGRERTPADTAATQHLTDVLDVLGRRETAGVAEALARAIAGGDGTAESALNALYRLEHRYSAADHPLCAAGPLREAVAEAAAGTGRVAEAAAEVETIHDFHGGL